MLLRPLQQPQEAVQDVEVVVEELGFQGGELVFAHPQGVRGVVRRLHGKGLTRQVEAMRVGDDAPALAALD